MAPPLGLMVKLGAAKEVFYLQEEFVHDFEDVYVLSGSGKKFGFNKCMLASLSWFCKELFLDLLKCPLSEIEENVYISTELSNAELQALKNFFASGKLPESKADRNQVDNEMSASFLALGLNLNNLGTPPFKTAGGVGQGASNHHPIHSAIPGPPPIILPPPPDSVMQMHNRDLDNKPFHQPRIKLETLDESYDDFEFPSYMPLEDYDDPDYMDVKPPKAKLGKKKKSSSTVYRDRYREKGPGDPDKPPPKKRGRKPKHLAEVKTEVDDTKEYFWFPDASSGHVRDLTKLYQCERCCRGFKTIFEYRMHFHRHDLNTEDYSRAFICLSCMSFEAADRKTINEHEKIECSSKRFDDFGSKFNYYCALCPGQGSRFDTVLQLKSHHTDKHKTCPIGNSGIERNHVCSSCGKTFANGTDLGKHRKKAGPHHSEGKCAICFKAFDTWDEHKKHLDQEHNGVVKHLCGYCGVNAFPSESEKSQHLLFCRVSMAQGIVQQFGLGEMACTICGDKVVATPPKVRQHLVEYHAGMGQKCEIPECEELLFGDSARESHMKIKHTKKYSCSICEETFLSKFRLKTHQFKHGADDKVFTCDICAKQFQRMNYLKLHRRIHDPDYKAAAAEKTKFCDQCGINIKYESYRFHMKTHHANEHVKCEVCEQAFKSSFTLKKHMQTVHTFLTCPDCGKSIKAGSMTYHKLQHHTKDSEMPYICEVCNKGFVQKKVYENHMNIHTGARPHNCNFCDRTFVDSSNRNKHMRESHNAEYQLLKASKSSMRLPVT